ncbi:alpha/beta hydrolase family protein [Dehalogenimonas sp. THU2]|uniref:alpha/beta hydrolase family protein n=1 Tax=Dehalogenimonas sp. THU2 TaxID=3151121 RepID=UPI0032188956
MNRFNPYDYVPVGNFTTEHISSTGTFQQFRVSFDSACPADFPEMNLVTGDYYLPRNTTKKHPLVVLVHGVGDTSTMPCRLLARSLAGAGIASLVLYMPIHSRRLPEEMKKRFYDLSAQDWFNLYRISVVNIRQVLDWAESRLEIDTHRLGVAGISFGGYVSAIAMGIDRRLRAGAFLFTAGNLEKLARTRSSSRFTRYDISEDLFRKNQSSYMAYVADVSARGFDNVPPPQVGYLFDPYTFCSEIKNKPVLMMNAHWDEYFPKEAANEFWEACGKPKQIWLPASHASAWIYYPVIRHHVVNLFRNSLMV